jgi:hypothetical protein
MNAPDRTSGDCCRSVSCARYWSSDRTILLSDFFFQSRRCVPSNSCSEKDARSPRRTAGGSQDRLYESHCLGRYGHMFTTARYTILPRSAIAVQARQRGALAGQHHVALGARFAPFGWHPAAVRVGTAPVDPTRLVEPAEQLVGGCAPKEVPCNDKVDTKLEFCERRHL